MASIRDVALEAGVGIGTVSRALNGTGYISEETKKRIMAAVEKLNYRPNELASNLSRNSSGFIGVLVPNLEHPFFMHLTKHLEDVLYQHGYRCMIGDTYGRDSRTDEFLELLQRNVMDGLITCVKPPSEYSLSQITSPIVAMDVNWGKSIPVVRSDHARGGELAAYSLLASGCEHVAQFLPSGKDHRYYISRYQAFREVMEKNGCQVEDIPIDHKSSGYRWTPEEMYPFIPWLEKVDGIFTSDVMAVICLKLAMENGIRVPEDLKIVGYDGMPFTTVLHPTLTAVRQDLDSIARLCVETIIKLIRGNGKVEMEQIVDVALQKGGTV